MFDLVILFIMGRAFIFVFRHKNILELYWSKKISSFLIAVIDQCDHNLSSLVNSDRLCLNVFVKNGVLMFRK